MRGDLLTIDLGQTTGWCYWRYHPDRIKPMTPFLMTDVYDLWQYGTVSISEVQLLNQPKAHKDTFVVIERMALAESHKLHVAGIHALTVLQKTFTDHRLYLVRPTDWKQRYKREPLPGRGVLKTQHEKDAYRMGIWFIENHLSR